MWNSSCEDITMLTISLHLLNKTVNFVASTQQECHILLLNKMMCMYYFWLQYLVIYKPDNFIISVCFFLYMDVIDPYAS